MGKITYRFWVTSAEVGSSGTSVSNSDRTFEPNPLKYAGLTNSPAAKRLANKEAGIMYKAKIRGLSYFLLKCIPFFLIKPYLIKQVG